MKLNKTIKFGLLMLAVLAIVIIIGAIVFARQYEKEPVYPSEGVTRVTMLSEYFPALEGTHGDTEVYILDSGVPGGTFLIYGGTHAPEIAGVMSSFVMVENAMPTAGRLIIIPQTSRHDRDRDIGRKQEMVQGWKPCNEPAASVA